MGISTEEAMDDREEAAFAERLFRNAEDKGCLLSFILMAKKHFPLFIGDGLFEKNRFLKKGV